MSYLHTIHWHTEGWSRSNNWFAENKLLDIWCGRPRIPLRIVLRNLIKCSVFTPVSKLLNTITFKNINNKTLCTLVFFFYRKCYSFNEFTIVWNCWKLSLWMNDVMNNSIGGDKNWKFGYTKYKSVKFCKRYFQGQLHLLAIDDLFERSMKMNKICAKNMIIGYIPIFLRLFQF